MREGPHRRNRERYDSHPQICFHAMEETYEFLFQDSLLPFNAYFISEEKKQHFVQRQGAAVPFTGRETYEQFLKKLCDNFEQTTQAKKVRFGFSKNAVIDTFDGLTMHEFTKKNKFYKSRVSVYLVGDLDKAMDEDSDQEPEDLGASQNEPAQDIPGPEGAEQQKSPAKNDNLDSTLINADDIKFGKMLCKGGGGDVYLGTWRHNPVVIKQLPVTRMTPDLVKGLEKEAQFLRSLNSHPNILSFYGFVRQEEFLRIVTEKMDVNLAQLVFNRKKVIPEAEKKRLVVNFVNGVAFIHDHDIVHGDLKLENVLLSNDLSKIKVCDFGLSREKFTAGATQVGGTPAGTFLYFAPEMFNGTLPNFHTDKWAVGVVVLEVLMGKYFWGKTRKRETVETHVQDRELPNVVEEFGREYPDMYDVVRRCFSFNPSERPAAEEVMSQLSLLL